MNETIYQILSALRPDDLQAADIMTTVRAVAGERAPSLAAFYRSLKTAIDEGWLEVVGSDASGPGRPRQIYRLTSYGDRALRREARRLQALAALALG